MTTPFLTRVCKIQRAGADIRDLKLSFFRPEREQGVLRARASLSCFYFDLEAGVGGQDEVQTFMGLLQVVLARLRGLQEEGYKIYWLRDGDLMKDDFWIYM